MSTFYDSPNDYRNYLCHYGVKGMRWRNRSRREDLNNPNRWDYTGAHREADREIANTISGPSGNSASRTNSNDRRAPLPSSYGSKTNPTESIRVKVSNQGKNLKRLASRGSNAYTERRHRIEENDRNHNELARQQIERDREAKRRQDADRRANSGLSNSKSLYQARRTKYGLNKLVNTRKNGHRH